ncbi:MAG: hypothetical protein HRU11_12460 [Parvularculaceae bacterium]|nr:hypothetical protein [Parvularculaceae bacterium]
MATTMFFEKRVLDPTKSGLEVHLEVGRTSFPGFNTVYLNFNGNSVQMDEATAREFIAAVENLGSYLGFSQYK